MADTELLIRIAAQDGASRSVQRLQSSIIRLVGAVASLAAAFKAVSFPAGKAIEFERALKDIQKTTEFTDEAINALGDSLRKLSRETGVAATELAEIAARAGQLGLGREGQQSILDFTDTIARFAVVADISVDQAATSLGKITNIFRIPIEQAESVSAAINELSNTTTATADQLIDVVRRVGDAGGLLEFAETAALAAQALELGQTPEVAGTAIIKTFSNAAVKAEEFASVLGITTQQWVNQLQTEGVGAIQAVATQIASLGTLERSSLIKTLFGGGRQFSFGAKFVQDAANDFKILNVTLRTAADAYKEATSAQEEYERITDSTQRQIEILGARLGELAIQFGDVLLPVIRDAVDGLNEFLDDPQVQARLQIFAETLRDALESFINFVAELANSEEAFNNFFNIIKLLVGLGLISFFKSVVGGVVRLGARLVVMTKVVGLANAGWRVFGRTLGLAATGATAASIASGQAAKEASDKIAAGQTKVITLTRQQTLLEKERNRLLANRLALRQRLVREGIRESQQAGQGFQSQLRRGRAVRDAVNAGSARGAGDQRVLTNLNTQIKSVDKSLIKAGTTAGRFASRFGTLAKVFGTVGRSILGFLGGPIGILITVLAGPLFLLISKFFGSLTDEVSEGGAKALAAARANLAETRKLIGAFREEVQKTREIQNLDLDVDIDEFSKGMIKATENVIAFGDASRGGEAQVDKLRAASINFSRQIEGNNKEIARQEQLIKAARAAFGEVSGAPRIDEATARIISLRAQNDALNQSVKETNDLQTAAAGAADEFGRNQATQIREIARFVDSNTLSVLRAKRDIVDLTEFLEEKTAKVKELEDAIAGDETGDLQRVNQLQADLATQVLLVAKIRGEIEKTSASIIDAGEEIQNRILEPQLKSLLDNKRVSREVFEEIADGLESFEGVKVDVFANLRDDLIKAITQAEIFGRQADAFAELAKRVNDTRDGIKGLADNLETSVRKSRANIADFNRELDVLTKDREINLRLNQLQDIEEGFGDRQIARIEENAQRRIDAIDSTTAAGARRIRGIEKERNLRVSALQVGQEDIATQRELQKLDDTRVDSFEELERLIKKSGELEKEIFENRAASTPEDIATQNVRIELSRIVSKQIASEREELQKLTDTQARFTGTLALDDFNPDAFEGRQFAISSDEIDRIKEANEELAEESLRAQTTLTLQGEKSADTLSNQIGSMNDFTTAVKDANLEVDKLITKLTIDPNNLKLVRAEIKGLVDSLGDDSAVSIADKVIAAFATSAIDEITLAPSSLEKIQEDVETVVNNADLKVLTNNILLSAGIVTKEAIENGARDAKPEIQFDQAQIHTAMQTAIGTEPYNILLNVESLSADGRPIVAPALNAAGGYIRGPGTGTSDSILSRLSDGEYVMDAFTTKVFGPNFFRNLQKMARGNPFSLPGYAAGGLVGDNSRLGTELRQIAELVGRGPSDEVTINFNAGGENVRLRGDRDQVVAFQRALRNVSRSGAR
jgi:TP901 family phage tail tape measure protein